MPRRIVVPVLLLALLAGLTTLATGAQAATRATSSAASSANSSGCTRAVTAGTSTQTITVGTARRTYLLTLPAGLVRGRPTPVIMGLHGGSDTAQNARRYMGLGGQRPAVHVYPQAPYWPEAGGVGWNVDPAGVDLPYFDALLAHLRTRVCVDNTRVFATGKSNGAFMVNALACFRPGMLRAIAPVAGGGPQTTSCPSMTSPGPAALIVHGSADRPVPLGSGRFSRDYWLYRNAYRGAAPKSATPAPCVTYPGTVRPVLWCQHPDGHVWPSWAGAGITNFFLGF